MIPRFFKSAHRNDPLNWMWDGKQVLVRIDRGPWTNSNFNSPADLIGSVEVIETDAEGTPLP